MNKRPTSHSCRQASATRIPTQYHPAALRQSRDDNIYEYICTNNMAKVTNKLPSKFQVWVDARKRFHLSHVHIQMARELGLNPKKFGSLANHDQERWKTPLPGFIEDLYLKRFGKERPDEVLSIEDLFKKKLNKTTERETQGKGEIRDSGPDEDVECPF